ncbi:MAG: hypothetical protein JO255_02520, partial [Alphaproteobacteria bacterium]|nr:hypothetical protein [Alphaproteobacteria bacterium]
GDPNPDQGHCVVAVDYDSAGIKILTWGMWGTLTWAAVAKYLTPAAQGEFHVVLTDEIVSKLTNKSPAGIDAAGLAADYAAMSA